MIHYATHTIAGSTLADYGASRLASATVTPTAQGGQVFTSPAYSTAPAIAQAMQDAATDMGKAQRLADRRAREASLVAQIGAATWQSGDTVTAGGREFVLHDPADLSPPKLCSACRWFRDGSGITRGCVNARAHPSNLVTAEAVSVPAESLRGSNSSADCGPAGAWWQAREPEPIEPHWERWQGKPPPKRRGLWARFVDACIAGVDANGR